MNKLQEIPIMFHDLEMFRTTLLAVQTFLEAQDMAKNQLNMLSELRFSPLTQDVQHGVKRIEGLVGDYLVIEHFSPSAPSEVCYEPMEPLPENPLGTKKIPKAPKMVIDDAERIDVGE